MRRLKYINAIGMELEGLWVMSKHPQDGFVSKIAHDGSVKDFDLDGIINKMTTREEQNTFRGSYLLKTGEIRVGPYKTMQGLINAVKENYPDVVNQTCGMHIHVSMNEAYYEKLMRKRFSTYFKESIDKLHINLLAQQKEGRDFKYKIADYNGDVKNSLTQLGSRISGKNNYCLSEFSPFDQIIGGNRYCAMNFCYEQHGTVECRVFNMMPEVEMSIPIIEFYIDMLEDYLERNCKNIIMPSFKTNLEVNPLEVNPLEENIIYI